MRKNKILKAVTMAACVIFSAFLLTGCGNRDQVKLDPDNPVSITVWHYYNGSQQATFDKLTDEFNATIGKEKGIYVESYSYGSVSDLETAINSSLSGEVGAGDLPDIFSSYADTAYSAQKQGELIDLKQYFSDDELSAYVDDYIKEGYFSQGDALYLLPVAKSTEIMMLNKTDWDKFAEATGSSLDELSTLEGVASVAERYYNWTDSLTPDVPNDGKAFYGRDSMSNYFVIGMRQMGKEIFDAQSDGSVVLNVDKELVRRLWDDFYVPYVKGYYAAYGKFRSDDVKTGDIIAYTGSTSSTFYFPDTVENEDGSYPIEYQVLNAPIMEGGENYMVQQGAGMAVTKSDEQHEYAACVFLKWFTDKDQNLRFVCDSGYMPVTKEANNIESVDAVIKDNDIEVNDKVYDCLKTIMSDFDNIQFYVTGNFENGYDARNVLGNSLMNRATEDKAKIDEQIAGGADRDEAIAPYVSDASFDDWYDGFMQELQNAVDGTADSQE